ncbi:MAG TPA: polyprenol monophosphomannose synthase [Verrucomicrobiae bacterium]|nr:polyprenol monophosphomannose synthase [Verrucomicrobiae bacterium]
MSAIVVVPTYNERENIGQLVEAIRKLPAAVHVLIVDDNSPDGTGQIADELSQRYAGEVFVHHRARKEGLGRAYVAAFQHVLKNFNYDFILQMDCDFSHDPGYLPEFLKAAANADLVIGSRYVTGVNVVNWDFKRLLLSKFASIYVRLITGMPFSDLTGGFKCWRRAALEALPFERIFSMGYLFQVETTYRTWKPGRFRIAEIPIIFYERNLGRSKIHPGIIFEAFLGVIRLRFTRIGA